MVEETYAETLRCGRSRSRVGSVGMTGTTQGTAGHRESRAAGAAGGLGREAPPWWGCRVPALASELELSSVRFSRLKQELFFSTNPFCLFCPTSPRPWLPACFHSTPTPVCRRPGQLRAPFLELQLLPQPRARAHQAPLPPGPLHPIHTLHVPSPAQALSQGSPGPLPL